MRQSHAFMLTVLTIWILIGSVYTFYEFKRWAAEQRKKASALPVAKCCWCSKKTTLPTGWLYRPTEKKYLCLECQSEPAREFRGGVV